MSDFSTDLEWARAQDGADELRDFRGRFHIPRDASGREEIYFCGNSLGLQPRSAARYLQEELEDWARLGVKGHFAGRRPWMPYHEQATERAAALVGALPSEVVIMNTLTVNLHLMMVSFYRPTPERPRLLIEKGAFPSDRYATASQVSFHGFEPTEALIELAPRPEESILRPEDVIEVIEREGDSIALILLPGVQYYTGQVLDMAEITRVGHAKGCAVGFDLAHATGNVVTHLHDWDVDFAAWCNYKYLNSGPGAVAGCFVHERHHREALPRFAGWWGHDATTRFEMGPQFVPTLGAEGWQLSNPPIMALAPVLASLEVFAEAGMERLRRKSEKLTGYLAFLLRERLADAIEVITPGPVSMRGCQLSLRTRRGDAQTGRRLFERLEANGVTGDWREPDVIRVAPVPLYNTFEEVHRFVDILGGALEGG